MQDFYSALMPYVMWYLCNQYSIMCVSVGLLEYKNGTVSSRKIF